MARIAPEASTDPSPGVATPSTQPQEHVQLYPRDKVFVHNDPVTPMALVVYVLTHIFGLETARATEVMYEAHHTGVAFVIALTLEQAEFRVERAHAVARGSGYPLTFTYEPE